MKNRKKKAAAQFPIKIQGNLSKLFISFQTVEVKDHEGMSGAYIFWSRYVFMLYIMVDSDNKTQNCTFQFVKW